MRIVIVGAGGIGGYYAARLIRAGNEVTLVARGPHLNALQSAGLQVDHASLAFRQDVQACDLDTFVQTTAANNVDLVIVAVKATATLEVAGKLTNWEGSERVPVLSLQNGVDNEAVLADALGAERIIGGLSKRIGGHVVAPGRIEASGPAETTVGPWPSGDADHPSSATCERIASCFNTADLPTEVTTNIRHALWKKLVANNGANPLSALTRLDTHAMVQDPHLGPIVNAMMRETGAAAAADGVTLTPVEIDEMFEFFLTLSPIKTSMLVDVEHGRVPELDAIPGAVIERAARLGIAVPYTQTVYALLKSLL